ncbi:MAG: hypothetical protein WCK02_01380 [Bacteroidota bacterium]
MKKNYLYWTIAILITIIVIIYQRKTGPTYPKKADTTINGKNYSFKLPRSHGGNDPCEIKLELEDGNISGSIFYKLYPSNDDFVEVPLIRDRNVLFGHLPVQPKAGKLAYYVELYTLDNSYYLSEKNPVIIRFKGDVPFYFLIPHIIFMFLAMLLSTYTAILAIRKAESVRAFVNYTFWSLLIGGIILGPIVQKFAFGEFWAGVPFAWDLTDNKTLIAFIAWLIAFILNRKKQNLTSVIIASFILLVIFTIPHSMFGSELDPTTGAIKQGFIITNNF